MEIVGITCTKCGWFGSQSALTCPRCRSPVKESRLRGSGKIVSFTVIRYPPRGFEKEAPYVVGLIDLDDGPRVIARIKANPEDVRVEAPVSLIDDSNRLLQFGLM
jgi:uncharacterized OB-fold protein